MVFRQMTRLDIRFLLFGFQQELSTFRKSVLQVPIKQKQPPLQQKVSYVDTHKIGACSCHDWISSKLTPEMWRWIPKTVAFFWSCWPFSLKSISFNNHQHMCVCNFHGSNANHHHANQWIFANPSQRTTWAQGRNKLFHSQPFGVSNLIQIWPLRFFWVQLGSNKNTN